MNRAGIVIFAVTYVLISVRRLPWLPVDRPTIVFVGAVACVAAGVLTPSEAVAAVDGSTILLLLSVMGLGAFLAHDGLFDGLESYLVAKAKSPSGLLGGLIWSVGILSALLTNDAVCVMLAPFVVRLVRKHQLPSLPFLLALASAANTGSVATLVGNPQNMLCATLGSLSYRDYLLQIAPVAIFGLFVNHLLIYWMYRAPLRAAALRTGEAVLSQSPMLRLSLVILAGTAVLATLGFDLAWTVAGGFALRLLAHRGPAHEVWQRIDWSLLVFFAGLFIVVGGFQASGAPSWLFSALPAEAQLAGASWMDYLQRSLVFLVGSNLVSNVPFILVIREQVAGLPDARVAWTQLAMASTFAGNLTLMGSVANLIVAQAAREIGGLGFWQHLRLGLPLTLLTTLVGTLWLAWT